MNRRLQLIHWVRAQHEGQLIKDASTPYFDHVIAVANRVAEAGAITFEIGLCHDLYEKCAVTAAGLSEKLLEFGYGPDESNHISSCVTELTRHFTKENSPLPKKLRRELEDERLQYISPDAQTIKYADLSYNADWMMAHDRHHGKDYLQTKLSLIQQMDTGNPELHRQVVAQFRSLLSAV